MILLIVFVGVLMLVAVAQAFVLILLVRKLGQQVALLRALTKPLTQARSAVDRAKDRWGA